MGARSRCIRLVSLLAALALLAAATAGCGQGRPARGDVVLDFVTWKPNQPEIWDRVLEMFRREHPDIRLARQIGPHSSTSFHDLLTQKLKNRSDDVDVFLMDVIWPPEFASAGWALPLDDFIAPEARRAFLPAGIQADTWRGRLYGVPLYVDAGVLYYRADLLRAHGFDPPATWPELARQARAVMAQANQGQGPPTWGYAAQFKQYEGLVCNMLEFILSNGGQVLDPDTGRCRLGEPAALEAVRHVRQQVIGRIAPRGALTYMEPEALALFTQGRAVFMRNWPYAWKEANKPGKSRVAGQVGIATLPSFAGGASRSTLGGWQLGIAAHTDLTKEAWTFVSFLTSRRVQKLFAVEAGRAPALVGLYDDPEVLEAQPHFRRLKEVFLHAAPRPRTPLYPAVSQVLQVYFSRALAEPRADLKQLAAQACAQIDELAALAAQARRAGEDGP